MKRPYDPFALYTYTYYTTILTIYLYIDIHICTCQGRGLSAWPSRCFGLYPCGQGRESENFVFFDGLQWVFTAWGRSLWIMAPVIAALIALGSWQFPSICRTPLRFDSCMVAQKSQLLSFNIQSVNWQLVIQVSPSPLFSAGLLWRVLPHQINGCCKYGLPFAGTGGQSSLSIFSVSVL